MSYGDILAFILLEESTFANSCIIDKQLTEKVNALARES
jgi:hypothetical protein